MRSLAAVVRTSHGDCPQRGDGASGVLEPGEKRRSLSRHALLAEIVGTENLPPLKLVIVHENPRVMDKGRLRDASNLPYLHRNPAV